MIDSHEVFICVDFLCKLFFRVGYILNMTKEVDNFYPNHFVYKKIWVSDEASTALLKHWQDTYEFIKRAKYVDCKFF